jgi:hypothetical protein
MQMSEEIEVEFHSKCLSDFQFDRLLQASLRNYTVPITAFISDAVIMEDTCLGVSFDHSPQNNAFQTPTVQSFEQEKSGEFGKRVDSGFLKREKEITLSEASCMKWGEQALSTF